MAYYASNRITGSTTAVAKTVAQPIMQPVPTVFAAGQDFCEHATIIFPSGTNPAANDVIELCILPPGCVMVDWQLWNDEFDSGTNVMQARIGLMTGTPGDATRALGTVGSEIRAAATTPWDALTFTRMAAAAAAQAVFQQAPSESPRSIGIGVTVSPNASPASARRIDFMLFYRAARYGA